MATGPIALSICDGCGLEYDGRFGKHGCNFQRLAVHKDALVIQPSTEFSDAVRRLCERLHDNATRTSHYWELGGAEGPSPYADAMKQIDATIGQLKRVRADLQKLDGHIHHWNEDDYCDICGMDGRA